MNDCLQSKIFVMAKLISNDWKSKFLWSFTFANRQWKQIRRK